MSQKIKNPNEKGNGFVVGIAALIAVVAVVIGVVVYMGRNQPPEGLPNEDVNFNVALDGDVIRLSSNASKDAVVANVYEDFSCHYCSQMAVGGHSDELAALNDGSLVVEYRTLNFLDNRAGAPADQVQGHSTSTYAIMRELAKTGDAKLVWNFHTMMMEDQQNAAKWSNDELADRIKALGAPSDLVDKVREGIDIKEAQKSAGANADKLTKLQGSVSSPHVFVGDKDVLKNVGQGQLGDWVKAAKEAKK